MSADRMPDLSAINAEIGRLVKECRTARQTSQQRLAEMLDMPTRHLQRLEAGASMVPAALIALIADRLGVAPGRLTPSPEFLAQHNPARELS